MKQSKFTESQVFSILKEAEQECKVSEITKKYWISDGTFYKWRAKYGGMDVPMVKRLRELEQENARLKRMYAHAQMDNEVLKEALEKSSEACRTAGAGSMGYNIQSPLNGVTSSLKLPSLPY